MCPLRMVLRQTEVMTPDYDPLFLAKDLTLKLNQTKLAANEGKMDHRGSQAGPDGG